MKIRLLISTLILLGFCHLLHAQGQVQTPLPPIGPTDYSQCDALQNQWQATLKVYSDQHDACLKANERTNCRPQGECSCSNCYQLHMLMKSDQESAQVNQCRDTVRQYKEMQDQIAQQQAEAARQYQQQQEALRQQQEAYQRQQQEALRQQQEALRRQQEEALRKQQEEAAKRAKTLSDFEHKFSDKFKAASDDIKARNQNVPVDPRYQDTYNNIQNMKREGDYWQQNGDPNRADDLWQKSEGLIKDTYNDLDSRIAGKNRAADTAAGIQRDERDEALIDSAMALKHGYDTGKSAYEVIKKCEAGLPGCVMALPEAKETIENGFETAGDVVDVRTHQRTAEYADRLKQSYQSQGDALKNTQDQFSNLSTPRPNYGQYVCPAGEVPQGGMCIDPNPNPVIIHSEFHDPQQPASKSDCQNQKDEAACMDLFLP